MELPSNITAGEKFDPAMKITDPEKAKEYFEACVRHMMSFGHSRSVAEQYERANLGYWAGYYGHDTRLRVESLYGCTHPVFGAATKGVPSVVEAFAAGHTMAVAARSTDDHKGTVRTGGGPPRALSRGPHARPQLS